mgnify:CR=1 FL=1
MGSVAGLFVLSGVVLFYVGFLWLLCCHAEGYFDDGVDDGRVACCVALGLMFGGLVCVVVPVGLMWGGLL